MIPFLLLPFKAVRKTSSTIRHLIKSWEKGDTSQKLTDAVILVSLTPDCFDKALC